MSRSRNLTTALAALLLAAPSLHAVDLQSVAGTDTKLRVYGFVHIVGTYFVDTIQNNATKGNPYADSLFYGPVSDQSTKADKQFQLIYSPSRLGFASTTPTSSLGDITTKIEMDFNGTNYPHTRLAQIDIGNWTIGQAWSTFNDGDAGADTVDWAGPIGAALYDTPRYPLIRYTAKIDKNNTFAISIEQNSGQGDGASEVSGVTKDTPAYLNEAGVIVPADPTKQVPVDSKGKADSKMPTFVAAYTYAGDWGHLGLRGLAQNYGAFIPATATTASDRYNKVCAAFMLSGNFNIAKDNLVFQLYTGDAVGNYGTGMQSAVLNDLTKKVYTYKNTGWMVGYTHNWTDAVRSNLIISGVSFNDNSDIAATNGTTGDAIKTAYSGNINTFIKLAKNCELGMEYVYEGAKAFGSNNVWTDKDGKAVNKNDASKLEVTLHVGF